MRLNVRIGWAGLGAASVALLLVLGCETPVTRPVEDLLGADCLAFVRDGHTTREDVILRLGIPSAEFEDGRILTYALRLDEEDQLQVIALQPGTTQLSRWCPGVYSLVLVFGRDGRLERHSLVVAE
jgi:hypothetical protein